MMDRRAFIGTLAGGFLAAPLASEAQQGGKTWQIGLLAGGARPPDGAPPLALRQALQELGYVERKNVSYLGRWADAKQDRLPGLAAELVGLKVHVIVTVGVPATHAAKQATSSIPIVMAIVGDAVGLGLIESLARPGGNVTGITDESVALSAKRLEILKEAVPRAVRLGVREPDDFDMAFAAMALNRPDALFLVTDALTILNRKRVIDFAEKHRIPAMYESGFLMRDGGLISYGADQDDNFRRAASYVDRIFKGATASALPVERPSRYYLTINLKTAKALGLTIPPSLLQRADQVIE